MGPRVPSPALLALGFLSAPPLGLFHSGGRTRLKSPLPRIVPDNADRTDEPRAGSTFRGEFAVNANITVMPKPSAYADARLSGLVVGGMICALGLGTLIWVLVRPGPATLGGTLLFSGSVMAGGVVVGWLVYALQAPSVLTVDGNLVRLEGPLIRRRVSTMQIQEIVRGWTGRGGMHAYLFVSSKLLLGGIVILASQYDRVELERLIAATGRPVSGDFTERV